MSLLAYLSGNSGGVAPEGEEEAGGEPPPESDP